MLKFSYKNNVISILSLLVLSGCGYDSQVRLIGKDYDYSTASVYVFEPKEDSFFNYNYANSVVTKLNESEFLFNSSSSEDSKDKISKLTVKRDEINELAISNELKEKYLSTIDNAIETHKKTIIFYDNLYTNKLDAYFKQKNPALFKEIDSLKQKLSDRKQFLKESEENLELANKSLQSKKAHVDKLNSDLETEVFAYIVENEILIPKKDVSFYETIYSPSKPNSKNECIKQSDSREIIIDDKASYSKETGLCHSAALHNRLDMDDLNSEHKLQLEKLIEARSKAIFSSAIDESIHYTYVQRAKAAIKKQTLLADNKFGTEREINNDLYDSYSDLNRLSKGLFNSHTKSYVKAKKGYRYFDLEKIVDELKLAEGLPVLGKDFNVENAFNQQNIVVALNQIFETELSSATVFKDIESDGEFDLGDISEDSIKIVKMKNNKNESVIAVLSDSGPQDSDVRELTSFSETESDTLLTATKLIEVRQSIYEANSRPLPLRDLL